MLAGTEAFRSIPNHGSHLTWWTNDGLRQLNLLLGTIFIAQFLNGYDASLVSGFQSMKPWLKNLGNPDSDHIGLLNAATYLAGLCTAPFAAFIADRWGRKWCIRYSSVTNLIGTAIGAAAGSGGTNGYAMFIMSRIIIGSGLAFALMCSPIMLQELPHPKHRTWMAGFFDVAFIIGNFVAAWVNFGCSHLTNNWAWRIPYLIHIGPALIMIILISFVPESPRWLIKNGREEEAKAFLAKYHANGKADDELVAFEYAEIQEALRMERETKQDTWKVILSSRSSRHRLGCVILIAICQNLSGTAIISYYYTSILKLVGITDTVTQTGINAGLTSFTFLMALFGLWLTQRVKRRPQLLGTWFAVLLANIGLTVCTAEYTKTKNKGAGIGAVVFVWLYNGAFFVSCGPIFFSYPAEVLHYSMRGKGMMVWAITAKCLSVFSAYTNPVAMRNIGYKWYTFYTAILVVTGVCIYFFIVETKGHTLEEIGQLFDGKPLETSLHPELATMEYKGKGDAMVDVRGVPDEENSLDRKSES
ncbi:general substrate transporter [Armillaria solidipes]|uniref:General substrate transporter n=1 Tax=Armillaria solidipes TaxID=1076256 RepID=A0A2H3BNB0_9AGAR|nr:general substrate transporter [Armillaria solidipes]